MFGRITISAGDQTASERFYRLVLAQLGLEPDAAEPGRTRWQELELRAVDAAGPATRHLHVGFVAPSHRHVEEFWRAGIAAGYADDGAPAARPPGTPRYDGAPAARPQYTQSYYGAFLRDPDGNSAEAVDHADTRRGGIVDHLWTGVRDLAAADAFYAAIARHTGLRAGRRWEHGVQLRGAWATFSLVADGRAPTEGLRIAFPAPDAQTVRDFHLAALAAGGVDAGASDATVEGSGTRRYAARAWDPDGTLVESVCYGSLTPAN